MALASITPAYVWTFAVSESSLAAAQRGAIAGEPQSDEKARVCLFHDGSTAGSTGVRSTIEGRCAPQPPLPRAKKGNRLRDTHVFQWSLSPPQGGT
jgi:hypothetical protein